MQNSIVYMQAATEITHGPDQRGKARLSERKCVRILQQRRDFLAQKLTSGNCSENAASYHRAEREALTWAIQELETMMGARAEREGARVVVKDDAAPSRKNPDVPPRALRPMLVGFTKLVGINLRNSFHQPTSAPRRIGR